MKTYREAYQEVAGLLLDAGIPEPDADAWCLLSYVTKMTRTDYFLRADQKISQEEANRMLELTKLRMTHKPLQYILGTQEFMGLEFVVNESVLIPRQDTEILVEEALKISKGKSVLDICTGSGCIIVSIAKLGDTVRNDAVDISPEALLVARENAKRNEAWVTFYQSDMLAKITDQYDIIVSNPPYIPTDVCETLMPEVRDYEPRLALDGTEDGLEFYRILARDCKQHLKKDGTVLFEIGCEQAEDVSKILCENGYYNIMVIKDYAHLDRVVKAQYQHNPDR